MQKQAVEIIPAKSEPAHPPAPPIASPGWEKPARYLAAVLFIFGLIAVIGMFAPVVQTIFLGFVFAIIMDIPARFLARRTPLSYRAATILFYVLLVVAAILLIVWLIPPILAGFQQLSAVIAPAVTEQAGQLSGALSDFALQVIGAVAGLLGDLVGTISVVGSALLLGFMLQLDLFNARGALPALVSPRYSRDLSSFLAMLDSIWSRFLGAQIAYGTVLGIATYAQNLLMGVPYPGLMALLTGVLSLIPTIGGLVSNIVVFVPCLLLGSSVLTGMSNLAFALLVFLINIPITQAAYYFFALPWVGKAVRLPIFVVTAGVFLGMALHSLVLAFLMVPIIATARVFGSYLLAKAAGRDPFQGETPPDAARPGFFSQLYTPPPADAPEQHVA